jgi:hypothetical protein
VGDWAPVPDEWKADESSAAARLVVDGEQFDVREQAGRPGTYHFAWVSGPNPGYGFTSARSDGQASTTDQLEDSIRGFLAQVDPETGYIE